MKTIKTSLILATGLLLAAGAQAQVTINISGAVAFRDTAYRAIRSLYGANLATETPDTPGNPSSSIKITWTGQITNLFGSQTVTIRANYNGAVAGIQDLVQNRDVSYFNPGDTNTPTTGKSDLAFGSVFQASTAFTSLTLEDSKFGLTPVYFVKSSTAPAGLTNITIQQFRALASAGKLPAWYFTGNTNDTALIYYVSRDPSAGQRVIVQKENGFTGNPTFYNWNTLTSSFEIISTNATAGLNATQIKNLLNISGPAISYLTGVDAIGVNGGANILALNGTKGFKGAYSGFTNDFSPVIYGRYAQWGYEHLLNLPVPASPNVVPFRNALLTKIDEDLQTSAHSIPISKAKVERSGEGSRVTPIP